MADTERAPTRQALDAAHTFMALLTGQGLDQPALVPCPDGSVQLEWHRDGVNLELAVERNGSMSFWYEGPALSALIVQALKPGDDRHIIDLRDTGWTIKHPLSCRPRLFECEVNRTAESALDEPPTTISGRPVVGRFHVTVDEGRLVLGEAVATDA